MRSSRSPIFLDNVDISLATDDALTLHEGVTGDNREPVGLLPQPAKPLGCELDRAPAVGIQALAKEGKQTLAVDTVADRAEETLVGTAKDLLILSFRTGVCAHRVAPTRIGVL
jgi:hypothetical protein